MAYTVDQLCAYASSISGLTDVAATPERTILENAIQDGLNEIFVQTACVITQTRVTLTAGADEYTMDRGILRILNYAQSTVSSTSALNVIPAEELLRRRFLVSSGDVRAFAMLGTNVLLVSPPPVTAEVIYFYVVPVPNSVISAGGNDIFASSLPVFGKRALQAYVCARALEHNHDYKSVAYWEQIFEKEIGRIKMRGRQLAGRRLAPNQVGYPDSYSGPQRNDVYSSGD